MAEGGGSKETRLFNFLPLCRFYLDCLPFNLHRFLPEVYTDSGLGFIGEAPSGEAECEAGLPHVGVPDDDDLKDPRLDAELEGGGAQIHGGCEARGGFVTAAGSAPADSV